MAHLVTPQLELPSPHVNVNVEYYDDEEKRALTQAAGRDVLDGASKTLAVPTPDFLAYYMYYKMRSAVPGFASHAQLLRKMANALLELDGQLEFADESIRLIQLADSNKGTAERIGEAIGLSVVSRLHGLHDGDWGRIPETNTQKTFDFGRPLASDGQRFLMVETKGSSATDNRQKPSNVSKHKSNIKAKKEEVRPREGEGTVLYGTIGVLDCRDGSAAQCWLVDPPADVSGDPFRYKVLARLEYIARWVSFHGNRSQFASALWTRLASLDASADITPFSGVPLRTGAAQAFFQEKTSPSGSRNQWFATKSVVFDEPVGGSVYPVSDDLVFFIAIQEQLVSIAAAQEWSDIVKYSFPAKVARKSVECVVPASRFDRYFSRLMKSRPLTTRQVGNYVRFDLEGHLYFCQSGLVFGVLPSNKDNWLQL